MRQVTTSDSVISAAIQITLDENRLQAVAKLKNSLATSKELSICHFFLFCGNSFDTTEAEVSIYLLLFISVWKHFDQSLRGERPSTNSWRIVTDW